MKLITRFICGVKSRMQFILMDYAFISFPKSGRTWVKSFLGIYISELLNQEIDYEFCRVLKKNKLPRILFSHAAHMGESDNELEKNAKRFYGKKIVFFARNPKDISFSYFFRMNKRFPSGEIDKLSFEEFIKNEKYGIIRIINFFNFWFSKRFNFKDFRVFYYEDFLHNPEDYFCELINFLSFPCDKNLIRKSINRSVDTTRKIENDGLEIKKEFSEDLKKHDLYFESSSRSEAELKRYSGNNALVEKMINTEISNFFDKEIKNLNSFFSKYTI